MPTISALELHQRATLQRLFFAVGTGEDGGLHVRHLDLREGAHRWCPWDVGEVLRWSPFRVRLNDTPRAGLHVTTEWQDAAGEMRYGSNFKIRDTGVFVLNPSNVMLAAESLRDALSNQTERLLLDSIAATRFGLPGGITDALASGLPPYALPDPSVFFATY